MSEVLDWNGDDSVVVRSVRGIAVFANSKGDIVIRQQADSIDDDDAFVVVPVLEVRGLIKALESAVVDTWEDESGV